MANKPEMKPEDRLRQYLSTESGLEVFCKRKSDDLYVFRFYFQHSADDKEWRYVLDVSEQDVAAGNDLSSKLEAAAWLSALEKESGKSVPLFEDGKFSGKRDAWPGGRKHKKSL